ncbi:MAG: Fis family transcriptional regulator, partial [Desulfobacula sp.]|nr:Fis family transcriptional regulator [Desulfobacula sp.]
EHAFVLCSKGDISSEHLPSTLTRQSMIETEDNSSQFPLKAAEVRVIKAFLKKNNYDRKATAKNLGIHKSTLFRKINKFGIKLPKIDGRCKR